MSTASRTSVTRTRHAPDPIAATLRKVFGLKRLRPGQLEVIERVLNATNTLAVMPTGAGKSLCYQLPALLLPGTTVVVSPLVALMKDQCDALRALGVAAVQINSALGSAELAAARAAVKAKNAATPTIIRMSNVGMPPMWRCRASIASTMTTEQDFA